MKRILLVDDQSEFLSFIYNEFSENFNVMLVSASSGRQAVEILGSGEHIDLIVCDYKMPDGDGRIVFQHLQMTRNPVPFILYTSWFDLPLFEGENFLGAVAKENLHGLLELAGRVIDRKGD